MSVCFVDTETTGLAVGRHQIWEVGLILEDNSEHHWFLDVDLGVADPFALKIGRYHERHPRGYAYKRETSKGLTDTGVFARDFAALTMDKPLVGAVVSFDEERLRRLLKENHECHAWHYHIIDVEAMAIGYLAAKGVKVDLPWKSDDLTAVLGLVVSDEDKHTALGDARWAKAIYDRILAG